MKPKIYPPSEAPTAEEYDQAIDDVCLGDSHILTDEERKAVMCRARELMMIRQRTKEGE